MQIKLPDDLSLKNEITEIKNRIDKILNIVNQYHSIEANSDSTKDEESDSN